MGCFPLSVATGAKSILLSLWFSARDRPVVPTTRICPFSRYSVAERVLIQKGIRITWPTSDFSHFDPLILNEETRGTLCGRSWTLSDRECCEHCEPEEGRCTYRRSRKMQAFSGKESVKVGSLFPQMGAIVTPALATTNRYVL